MLDLTIKQIEKLERVLYETPNKIPIAVNRAVGRTIKHMKTEAARKIRQSYIVKHGDALKILKSHRPDKFSATLEGRGYVVPIEKFKLTPKVQEPNNRRKIKATVKKGSGAVLSSAFTTSNGVFERKGKKRYPIRRIFGPSIPSMMNSEEVSEHVYEKGREMLDKRLDHEINQFIQV